MIPKPTHKKLFRDIEGQTFGRWTVESFAGSDNGARWLCQCQCGAVRVLAATQLFQGSKSCGCLQRESAKETGKTLYLRRREFPSPAKTHGKSKTREYAAWNQMIQRCYNRRLPNFDDYGGRGITVCREWLDSFEAFFSHVGPRPTDRHSLDRIQNDKGYEPGNVQWATRTTQSRNRNYVHRYAYGGETLTIPELAQKTGIKRATLYMRLVKMGWSVERATSVDPADYHRRKGG